MKLPSLRRLAFAATLCACLPCAHAFKSETHIWVGQQVINDLADDGKITVRLNGKPVILDVPADVRDAILSNRSEFLLGQIGPDSAPDLIVGQGMVHPGDADGWKTNDWLQYLLNSSRNNAVGKAYTYGYLGHAATDMFAHTYVNQYAGNIFDIFGDLMVVQRHMALEGFIAKLTPPLADKDGKLLGAYTAVVKPSTAFGMFARDTLVMNETVYQQYRNSPIGVHLAAYYKYRQGINSLANDPRWNKIDAIVLMLIAKKFNITLSQQNSQKIIDRANQVIPKLQKGENKVQGMANDMLNAANGLDETAFRNLKANVSRLQGLENELLSLDKQINDYVALLPKKTCNDIILPGSCKVADWVANLNREINKLKDTSFKKRDETLKLVVAVRDTAVKGQKLVQIIGNVSIDFAQRLGSNTSPIKATLLGWRDDVDVAMLEYTKATSQMILNGTDPNADSFAAFQRWFDCYHMSILGLPHEISGCAVRDGANDVMWAMNRVTKLADDLSSAGELFGLPSPSEILAWQDEALAHIKDELQQQVTQLLPQRVRDALALLKGDITDATLNSTFSAYDGRTIHDLVPIPDMAARVKAEMSIKNGAFDPEKYAVARNSVTLAKLALLDKAGLNRLAQLAGVQPDTNGQLPFAETDNIVANAIASIDGNHQWMAQPPKWPTAKGGTSYMTPPSYAAPAGFVPWRAELRNALFRPLFTGPLSPGIDSPRQLGFSTVLPADYQYRPCKGNPFPADENDHTCAFLDIWPTLMTIMQ